MTAGEFAQPNAVALVLSVKAAADLRIELNRVFQNLERIESFVDVVAVALRAQACDIDTSAAAVLDEAARRIEDARASLETALASLPARGAT